MDAKELDSTMKALTATELDSEVIDILERLKKDVVATEELLRSTKAGMKVARLRSNTNKDIGRLASDIVSRWKKQVEANKLSKRKPSPQGGDTGKPSPQDESKGFVGVPAKRRWETDKVDIKRTPTPTRDSCVGLLYNGLAFMSEESATLVIIKAVEIEAAAFKTYKGETAEYRTKLRSLFQNLKQISNHDLRSQVLSGEITPEAFVVMTHDELKSKERQEKDKVLDEENMKKAHVPIPEKSISNALTCGRCGNSRVSYVQAQTRSADEPMTTFAECAECGNRWKSS